MKNLSLLFCFLFASLWACRTSGESVKGSSEGGQNFISFEIGSRKRLFQGDESGALNQSGSSISKIRLKDGAIVIELNGNGSSVSGDAIRIAVASGDRGIPGKRYIFGPRTDTTNWLEYFSGYGNEEKRFYTVDDGHIIFERFDEKLVSGSFEALVELETGPARGPESLKVSNGKFEIKF